MEPFENYRPLLFSIAYRMLGSAMDAEDIVQDAYLRYQAVPPETVTHPKAFLSTIVTRLCLNQLQSAREKRETYIGTWLPEPVFTGGDGAALFAPASEPNVNDNISIAFLVLLESLSPAERAVFLLREVFDYDYGEIAQMLGKEESACRQLFSRAKKHVTEHRPRFKATPEEHNQLLGQFLLAIQAGDLNGLTHLLAENATHWSDGGGKVNAAIRPVIGAERIAKLFLGVAKRAPAEATYELADINGKLALVIREKNIVTMTLSIETDGGLIQQTHVMANPEKLKHL